MNTTIGGAPLTVCEDGDANVYTILAGDNWLATLRLNGTMTVERQREWLALFVAAPAMREALRTLVEAGGIGPETMFHDARDAIKAATRSTQS